MDVPTKKKHYAQNYRSEWEKYEEFKNWLKPVPGDSTKAFCSYCHSEMYAKLNDLKKHLETKKHKKQCELISHNRQLSFSPAIANVCNFCARAECTLALYIAEHSSIRHIDHLTDVCKKCFKDSKSTSGMKLHRTKCTQIINYILEPHFEKELRSDIGNQKYSLLIDESTDISVTKYLGIVTMYFSLKQNKVVSAFLALRSLDSSDAVGIVTTLVNCLKDHNLDLQSLIGIGTDNAAVMTGSRNSVYMILKTQYNLPHLILIPCICHSLQLAVNHASENTLPRNIEFLIRETHNWFSHSTKRQIEYKQIFELINCGEAPLKILKVCETRWLSIEPAIVRILSQWDALKIHFFTTKDKCYTAEILYAMYSDEQNRLYMYFLKSVLGEVQQTIKIFESEKTNPLKLLKSLMALLRSVCQRILLPTAATTDKDYINLKVTDHLNPVPYLGYLFESQVHKLPATHSVNIAVIRSRCIAFNVKLVEEIQKRLPRNYEILEKMSLLSEEETLKQSKDTSIIDLAKEMGIPDEKIDKILQQWQSIHFVDWSPLNGDPISFWAKVAAYKNAGGMNSFQDLCDFATAVLSLPHSNAEVERVFSAMNIVKNKLRNKLSEKTLNSLLLIRNQLKIKNKNCSNYELPDEVVNQIGQVRPTPAGGPGEPSTSADILIEDPDDFIFDFEI